MRLCVVVMTCQRQLRRAQRPPWLPCDGGRAAARGGRSAACCPAAKCRSRHPNLRLAVLRSVLTPQEDTELKRLVHVWGTNWTTIAREMQTKCSKQVRVPAWGRGGTAALPAGGRAAQHHPTAVICVILNQRQYRSTHRGPEASVLVQLLLVGAVTCGGHCRLPPGGSPSGCGRTPYLPTQATQASTVTSQIYMPHCWPSLACTHSAAAAG